MKKLVCLLSLIMLVIGVCGCMNNEYKSPIGGISSNYQSNVAKLDAADVQQAALSYLAQKYGRQFNVELLKLEYDGQDTYYRMVFSGDQPEKGVLYCSDSGKGTTLQIDDVSCVVRDNYANVILQTQYAQQLQQALGSNVLVKCQLKTPDGTISDADFAAGLKASAENPAYGTVLYVVVLSDISAKNSDLREKVETIMGQMNVYRQYLYVAYETNMNLQTWEIKYSQNANDFARYVAEQSDAEYIEYTAFHANEGITKQTVVKE